MRAWIFGFWVLMLWSLSSCVNKVASVEASQYYGTEIEWLGGKVNDGFKKAHKEKKPVLLFWGAAWCPACVELKNNVFSHPRIKEVLSEYVLIYIDGDMDHAQAWGEIFDLTSYPSIVVLNDKREEILRIQESLNFLEFERLMQDVRSHMQPIADILTKVENGEGVTDAQWRSIAYFSWNYFQNKDYTSDEWIQKRALAFQKVPDRLKAEKALIAAKLLEDCAMKKAASCLDIAKNYQNLWQAMNADAPSRYAVRSTLLFASEDILTWVFNNSKNAQPHASLWIDAVKMLRSENGSDENIALFSDWIGLQWSSKDSLDVAKIRANIQELDRKLSNNSRRHVWLSGAISILKKISDWDSAERLLKKELLTTDHSFYVYSMLAQVYLAKGDKALALDAMQKAKAATPAGATKIQWLVREMKMLKAEDDKVFQGQKYRLIQEFYNTVFGYPAGFYGRAYRSVNELEKVLVPSDFDVTLKKGLGGFRLRCQRLTPFARKRCVDHFDRLLLISGR
jgi:protein disulfide-isomerase